MDPEGSSNPNPLIFTWGNWGLEMWVDSPESVIPAESDHPKTSGSQSWGVFFHPILHNIADSMQSATFASKVTVPWLKIKPQHWITREPWDTLTGEQEYLPQLLRTHRQSPEARALHYLLGTVQCLWLLQPPWLWCLDFWINKEL